MIASRFSMKNNKLIYGLRQHLRLAPTCIPPEDVHGGRDVGLFVPVLCDGSNLFHRAFETMTASI